MRQQSGQPVAAPLENVFKALADPIRLEIMRRLVTNDEVACTLLEEVLDVAKSTISYHVKVLHQADLVEVRKEGRYYFYSLHADSLDAALPGLKERIAQREPYVARK